MGQSDIFALANSALARGDRQACVKALHQVLARPANDDQTLGRAADTLMKLGDFRGALVPLKSLTKRHPKDVRLRAALINSLIGAEDFSEAIRAAKAGSQKFPHQPGFEFDLARAYGLAGDLEKSIATLKHLLRRVPDQAAYHAMLGVAYNKGDQVIPAVLALSKAVEIEPDNTRYLFDLASVLIRNDEWRRAAEICERIVAILPNHVEALAKLAEIYVKTQQWDQAKIVAEKALALRPDDALTLASLIMSLAMLGQPKEAVRLGEEGRPKLSSPDTINRNMALACFRADDFDRVLDLSERMLAVDVLPTVGLAMKSSALMEMGRESEASDILSIHSLVRATKANVPDGYPDLETFNRALTEQILAHPQLVYWENNVTLHNERCTLELFDGRETGAIKALKSLMLEQVEAYLADLTGLMGPEEFKGFRPSGYTLGCWGNVMADGGQQLAHYHPNAWLSGVYYPCLPEDMGEAEADELDARGGLEVGRSYYHLGSKVEPPLRTVVPTEGTIILFPSYVGHQTIPVPTTGKPRISMAFNLFPEALVPAD